jgi:hypothetical protein
MKKRRRDRLSKSDRLAQRSGRNHTVHRACLLEQPLTRDLLGVYRVLERVDVAVPAYLGAGRR